MVTNPGVTEHGNKPLFMLADSCGHPEPPEPGSLDLDDPAQLAWEDWDADHPASARDAGDGERLCLLTPCGTYCPACTAAEREECDLPDGEYVACRLAGKVGN